MKTRKPFSLEHVEKPMFSIGDRVYGKRKRDPELEEFEATISCINIYVKEDLNVSSPYYYFSEIDDEAKQHEIHGVRAKCKIELQQPFSGFARHDVVEFKYLDEILIDRIMGISEIMWGSGLSKKKPHEAHLRFRMRSKDIDWVEEDDIFHRYELAQVHGNAIIIDSLEGEHK